mmetsp:Transcript_159298/g.281220  ORF Transcript_159298/g.281220 Transcript_159298/m.281220 type:complete len:274 (-) Transcript_159298:107-928(-)
MRNHCKPWCLSTVVFAVWASNVHKASALLFKEIRIFSFHSQHMVQAPQAPAPAPTTEGWLCSLWPTERGTPEERCNNGNNLNNEFEYMYNTGATATRNGACGVAGCECCMRVRPAPTVGPAKISASAPAPAPAAVTTTGPCPPMWTGLMSTTGAPTSNPLVQPVDPPPPAPGNFFREVSELLTCPHLEEMVAAKCGSVPLFQSLPQFEDSIDVCLKALQTVPELGELFTRYFGPHAGCKTRIAMWRFKGFDSAEKCFATTRTQSFAVTCRFKF